MRLSLVTAVVSGAIVAVPSAALSADFQLDRYSQQISPGRAQIGASVGVTYRTPGSGGSGTSASPQASDPTPAGSRSFWYRNVDGDLCMYVGSSGARPCVTFPASPQPAAAQQPAAPAVDPVAVAASAARRLDLTLGRIAVSPSPRMAGLTGAASWFWLEPSPQARSLSVSVEGERVTVTADSGAVEWRFGDGTIRRGGPGRPYRRGQPPKGAIRHRYETRCLPGDQGRNPYVLASCGSDGYRVEAAVGWAISYTASGPVAASGALPARTTETAVDYPVSEARGFLASGGGR